MIVHSIVYVILSILAATTVYAASAPISKVDPETYDSEETRKDANDSL